MADQVERGRLWLNPARVQRLRLLYALPPEEAIREEAIREEPVPPQIEEEELMQQ